MRSPTDQGASEGMNKVNARGVNNAFNLATVVEMVPLPTVGG